MRQSPGVAVAMLLLSSCAGREPDVEPQRWVLTPTALAIGGMTNDKNYTLSDVAGATLTADGGVIVADHYFMGLRAYDASGAYVGAAGGKGQGPGEYQTVRGIWRCEDGRIVTFEANWERKVYLEDLTLVDEQPSQARGPGLDGPMYRFSCAPTGYAIATGWGDETSRWAPGLFVMTAPVVLLREGLVAHDFGDRATSERVGFEVDGMRAGSGPHPFGRSTRVALGTDRVFMGDGSGDSIAIYDFEGDRIGEMSWHGPSRVVTDGDYDLYVEETLASTDEMFEPAAREWLNGFPEVTEYPSYDRIEVARDGFHVWVHAFAHPGATDQEWRVFDPDGVPLAWLKFPATWEILEIGSDYCLFVERDSYDVETVRLAAVAN